MHSSVWSSDVCSSVLLDAQPEVKHQLSNLGHGNPRVYYNVFLREDASNYAEVFVQLKAYDAQRTPLFLDRLRARFNALPGAELIVKEFANGPPIEAPIALRVIGPEPAQQDGRAHA